MRSLIWKPIPVVFIEWKHNIDFHREIYNENNPYKSKINILTWIEILSSSLLRVGDMQRLVRPCSLYNRNWTFLLPITHGVTDSTFVFNMKTFEFTLQLNMCFFGWQLNIYTILTDLADHVPVYNPNWTFPRSITRDVYIRPCHTHGMTDSTFFFKMKPNLIWHKQNIINFWQYIGLHNAKDLRWFNLKYIRFICTCRNCFRISPRVQHMPMLNGILPTQRHRYRKDFFVFSLKLIIKTFCLLVLTIYTAIMQLCTL